MDWSPYRPALTIVLGFALLLNPFVVGALDVGDPDWYRYEATEVEFHEDGTVTGPEQTGPIDDDVACLGSTATRTCMLERAVHARGGVTFDGIPDHMVDHRYRYVHIWEHGFFRPTSESVNGTIRYTLERVSREQALENVATPLDRMSPGVRQAVQEGVYETRDELADANQLVVHDGAYYTVHRTAMRESSRPERPLSVVVSQWVLGVIGAVLVLRGQRARVRRKYHGRA